MLGRLGADRRGSVPVEAAEVTKLRLPAAGKLMPWRRGLNEGALRLEA